MKRKKIIQKQEFLVENHITKICTKNALQTLVTDSRHARCTYLKNLGKGCNTDFRNSDRNRKIIDLTFSYVITCALKHTTTKMHHFIKLQGAAGFSGRGRSFENRSFKNLYWPPHRRGQVMKDGMSGMLQQVRLGQVKKARKSSII